MPKQAQLIIKMKVFGVKCQILREYSKTNISVRVETIDGGERFIVSDEILCQRGFDDFGTIALIKAMLHDDPYRIPKGYHDTRVLNSTRVLRVKKDQVVTL